MFDEKIWGRFWLFVPLVLLASCNPCWGQIKVQPQYASGQPVVVSVAFPDAPEDAKAHVLWTIGGDAGYLPQSETVVGVWPKYGLKDQVLKLRCSGFLTTEKDGVEVYVKDSHREFEAVTKILGIGPSPQPDPEPGPEPDPTPDPEPDVEAPISEPGFRVLIVYESQELGKLPEYVWHQDVRDYLTAKCVRGPKNVAEWRMVDPQVIVAPDSPIWAKALSRKRDSVPWLIVSNGKAGFEGPLPASKADMMALLTKYAEGK